jgi:predicted DNA-binding antitoxin AbrB/MazE fold protein
MSQQIDAIYDGGVLKPIVPLSLPDKSRVRLTVDPADDQTAPDQSNGVTDLDAELESLLFDGPTLPADFSRADIYADHD